MKEGRLRVEALSSEKSSVNLTTGRFKVSISTLELFSSRFENSCSICQLLAHTLADPRPFAVQLLDRFLYNLLQLAG